MTPRIQIRIFILLLAVLPLTGCFFRSYTVDRQATTAPLREASLDQLVETINGNAARLQTLNATVDINTSVGGQQKGKVTEYQEISGYVLVRKPEQMRMIGLVPVLRSNMFDMVSNGKGFELSIPPRNKFIVGSNQMSKPSPQPLENLRPQHIFDALLLKPVNPSDEIAFLRDGAERVKDPKTHKEIQQPDYVVGVLRRENNIWCLSRQVIFSRVDLLPHRQLIYNFQGHITTDARYENFTDYQGTPFPSIIDIERPIEEYSIRLSIEKLRLNEPLRDDQFVLTRPEGSQLVNLDEKNGTTAQYAPVEPIKPKQMR